jgi:hypothetical protein
MTEPFDPLTGFSEGASYADDWDAPAQRPMPDPATHVGAPSRAKTCKGSGSTPCPPEQRMVREPAERPLERPLPAVFELEEPAEHDPIAHWARPDFFPSLTARSSLFCASRLGTYNTDDKASQTIELKCQGASLVYTGPRLDMHDKLVWETAVQIAKDRKAPVGTTFVISLRDFAGRMGWKNPSGTNLKWIWTSIKRLSRAHLEYRATSKDGKLGEDGLDLGSEEGVGNLIAGAVRTGDSYSIQICEHFSKFAFELDKQFLIQIKRRETLKGLLAKWLHDFLSTHTKEQEFDLCYLRELSGFTGRQKDFPVKLKQALDELGQSIPSLVAGHEIQKIGKSSDEWRVLVQRGDEKPQFLLPRLAPSRIETPPKVNKPKGASKRSNRSGPAL